MLAATLAMLSASCAPRSVFRAEALPPLAPLQLERGADLEEITRGQGVWIGSRILTAAHVLMPDRAAGDASLARELLVNGEPVRVLDFRSGDLATVFRLYDRSAPTLVAPVDLLEDWAVIEVASAAPAFGRMRLGDGKAAPGETLYVVGVEPKGDQPRVMAIPLVVFRVVRWNGQAFPERLVAVRASTRDYLHGWSGAFVGRYDARAAEWEYVGQLVMGQEDSAGRIIHVVLRPPPEALDWLMQEE